MTHPVEAPEEPEMGKALNAPERVGIAVFRLKDHPGADMLRQPRLAGHAEFIGKIAPETRDDVHGEGFGHPIASFALVLSPISIPQKGASVQRKPASALGRACKSVFYGL